MLTIEDLKIHYRFVVCFNEVTDHVYLVEEMRAEGHLNEVKKNMVLLNRVLVKSTIEIDYWSRTRYKRWAEEKT